MLHRAFWMAAFLCLFSLTATGSEITFCAGGRAGPGETYGREIVLPTGATARLAVSDAPLRKGKPSSCRHLSLPVPAKNVIWAGPVAREEVPRPGGRLMLQGLATTGGFEVSEIVAENASSPSSLPHPAAEGGVPGGGKIFGVEERANFDGRILSCRKGRAPAGALLHPQGGWSGERALSLLLKAQGSGRFTVGLADAKREAAESSFELGSFEAGPTVREFAFSIPPNPRPWTALTLICPNEAARLELIELNLQAKLDSRPVPRSAWVWSPAAWSDDPASIWALQGRHGLSKVYVTVPVEAGRVRNAQVLEAFVTEAGRRGLEVWPVSGDPRDVLPSSHPALLARVRAYADYNRAAAPEARFAGIQLDIEPYLLPGYGLAPGEWRERYAATIRKVRSVLDTSLSLDLVMPVWWGENPHWGHAFLDSMAPLAAGITVMNYRTDVAALQAGAHPFLEWSGRHGRWVTMALETGPVADEAPRHYRASSDGGELWILPWEEVSLLLLLSEPATGLPGRAYRYSHAGTMAGKLVTFAGDAERLEKVADRLLPAWAVWPHFSGLAIHGLEAAVAPVP